MESNVVRIRRQLHMYPEIGFDLPLTLQFLRDEMDAIGVDYTEQYGKSSIVATVNPEKTNFTLGIRADMDALPMEEKNDVPYRSRIKGQMHACGHDAHTAIALETLRRVYEERDAIGCRVKFLFQPSEEAGPSGAMLMAEDGVMDDIDCIVALHCDTTIPVGKVAVTEGAQNAISDGFTLVFHGKSSHAGNQEKGIDAIMMAVKAYTQIEFMIAKDFSAKVPMIFNVGAIHGGVTNNILAESCTMFCTLRSHTEETAAYALDKIRRIGESVAELEGGRFEMIPNKHYPIVYNDAGMVQRIRRAACVVVGADNLGENKRSMGGEDFSYFAMKKPGGYFRLGVRNEEKGIVNGVHHDNFDLDEAALEIGVRMFLRIIRDAGDAISRF
ncbi:MAG: amidohydrolase [Clostridia bacterium]|nr:amidohydrolase [Clostridia bacterium]